MIIENVLKHYNINISSSNKAICPFHSEKTPSLNIYPINNSFYCFGCGKGGNAAYFIKEMEHVNYSTAFELLMNITGLPKEQLMKEIESIPQIKEQAKPLDMQFIKDFIATVGYKSNNYRGIPDNINRYFGHLTKLDENGNVTARYYPETNDNEKVTGYKCRNHPKDFSHGKVGETGCKSQLSGQVKYKGNHKYVLYVGGEEDKAAAYHMLLENQKKRLTKTGVMFEPVHVVSPTAGENSAAKQAARQYEFFDRYDVIVIGMDNDEAGIKAAQEIAKVLPKEKVRIATWSGKDPNQMLLDGKEDQFVREFYSAKEYVNSGIQTSNNLIEEIKEELRRSVITLPNYMKQLTANTKRGGLLQGRIINIIGDTSVGKSSHLNGMVYHWLFNAPEKVGVVSLEATAGQYALDMLSIHLEKNLTWMGDGETIIDYLDQPEVKALYNDLWCNEFGEPRWAILDDREGDIKSLEKQINKLIHQHGCRIIVIDVLSDVLRGSSKDSEEDHMKWQKNIVKSGVTIVNALHTRKPPVGNDGVYRKATEYDALGSGTFIQSAAVNIVINRNKMSEDVIVRNSTEVDIPKLRGGVTGPAGKWYYDQLTRKVYDLDDYLKNNQPDIILPEVVKVNPLEEK